MRLFSISYVLISVSIALPVYGQTTVAAGEDIVSGYLNKGKYDLSMSGDVSWNTVYTYAAGNTNNLTIDGNGHRITFGPSTGVYFNFNRNNGSLAINDAMVGTQTFASARDSLFWIGTSGITTNFDFNGTTFQNIGPTNYNLYASANYGPIISQRVNSVTNINGGEKGVTFLGNHGLADQPGTIGISSGTMNFYNNVTFDSNWSANYSGAMAIYSDAPATVNFNGTTSFHNNHTGHYGGAIDMWGGNGSLVFNGDASFTDNYTYSVQNTTQDFPNHYTDRSASGGAIHVGFLASSGATGTSITFNDDVIFDGNFVNDLKTNAYNNAQGGAIGLNQSRETGNRNYNLYLNGNSVFNNNYVYSANGNGLGGAIFLNTQTGSVNIAGEAEFTNNTAKSLGGAIYVRKGTLNINANKGDIVFKGNRQGATFVSENRTLDTGNSYIFYKPVEGTGTPNSIYWETSNALTLNGTQGNAIRFYDPLALVAGATLTLDQNGTGETVFYGDNGKSTAFDTDINVNTNINSGTFTVADGVNYGRTTYGTFNLKNSATLKGENSGTLKAATINLNSGSGIAVAGGTLLLDSANIALGNTAGGVVNLSGYGTVNSSSTLKTGYTGTTVNANIGLDESSSPGLLRLEAPVSGTTRLVKNGQGTLLLPTVQNYSDGTIVNEGVLMLAENGTLGKGNVTINTNGTLQIDSPFSGNYNFGNVLLGNGLLKVGLASGTNTFDFSNITGTGFAGTLELDDSLFSLAGNNTTVLGKSTLRLNSGNTTNVGAGEQIIGNLQVNGGLLRFPNMPTGVIRTDVLTLDSGTVQVNADTSVISAKSLLVQDDSETNQLLVRANAVQGAASDLVLQNLSGSVASGVVQSDVEQEGNTVAVASYAYGLKSISDSPGSNGLFTSYRLTELELKDSQTLTLSGDETAPAGSNDMKAKITGSGNLAISATDRIILANSNNDYRGSTTVSEGTLQLGTDHALGETRELNIHSGARTDINGKDQKIGTLNGEGELDINRGNLEIAGGGEFGGVISGSAGTLALSGGTLTLTGENTYKGEATVTAGTLQIGNGGTTGSYAGDIANNGTVGFNRSDDIVYDGVITGSGNLVKEGNGTLILTGNNDYAGGTSIDGGTLQIGDGGTTGSVAGNISNDGKLVFNRSDDIAYGGIISGNGSLVKAGNGELTLTGDHTYTGTTSVGTGILRLGDGGTSGSVSGNIVNAGVVVFNRADDLEYDGVISGTGQMQQAGSGTVTFTGKNSYGGGTLISDGTIRLTGKGSIGSGVIDIASQGTLFIDNPDGDTYTFDNRLEGDGKLLVTLESSSDTFDFSHSVGSGFSGEVKLDSGSMILGDANSSVLSQATLELGKNGSVTLDGDRSIGNLTFSGGQLNTTLGNGTDVDVLTVGYLNVDAKESPTVPGTVNYKGSASLNPDPDRSGNLLLQGDVNAENSIAIVKADAVSSAGTQLNLLMDGVVPADKTVVTNDGFGNSDLRATYGYMAVITDNKTENMTGLFGGYVLKTLESTTNAILDSATAPDANFGTKLTGSGDFEFRAHDNSITLLNAANDYSGQTTVTSGTLNMGANDVFGHTSALNIRETATVNMNGFRQNIGELNGETGSTLDLGGGDLTIAAGGKSNGDLSGSGYLHLSGGTLTVANANEKLDAVIDLQSGATARLQSVKGLGNGNINLSGDLQLSGAQGTMENRLEGTGIVSLTNGSNVGFSADNADFSGSIHIGSGTTLSATSDSQLGTATVTNEGNLVLHSDDDWKFDNVMNGSGKLVKEGEGIVRISSEYAHEGGTEIMHGSLVMDGLSSALSGSGDVRIAEGASLGGYGLIGGNVINQGILAAGSGMAVLTKGTGTLTISGNLTNSGSIHLGGDDAGNVLRVKGDYSGSGLLVMNTVLGDDSSVTDKLIVEGNTSGSTAVMLNNAGGMGNATHNGIQIVQVDGISDGEFHLGNRVVQGAYDYRLYKGSVDNPDDGDWYLRSTRNDAGTAPIRPEVGAYLANRDAALTMFRHTLQDRTGNRQFLESAVAGENAEAFWGYVEADYGTGRSAGQIDQRRWGNRIQVGSDIFRSAENINNWRVGVMAGYGTVRSRSLTDGQVYRADSDLTGYSAGVYTTWYSDARKGASGPYLDSWLQHSWFKNQVKGEELDENRYNSRAWSGSLEGGWTFDAYTDKDYHVYVQPQAQIVYTRYHANDVVESNGTVIENRHKNGISTRLGTRIFGYSRGKDTRWQPYAELNWWHNQKTSMIRIEDENFDSGLPNDIAELKTGFEVMLNENVNAWAQMRLQKGEKSYKSVGGFAGVRINW